VTATEVFFLRRTLLLAALVALVLAPRTFAGTFIKSVDAAKKQAREKKQLIFVDMFAEWCGWCHRFEAEVVPSEAFQKATEDMVLLRLDTEDGTDGTALAQRYQISTLPTFLILNPDLSIVGFIRGYAPPSEFARMIAETLKKDQDFQKLVKSEATFAKDYQRRLDLAREFRFRQNYAQSEPRLQKLVTEKGVPEGFRDQAYYELGVVYLYQRKFPDVLKTINQFSKVQTKGESYERARLLASDVCLAQGNLRCAANELKNFKQTFPNSPLIPNVDMMLPSIERQLAPVKQ
jgi:thioredoxin-related protein